MGMIGPQSKYLNKINDAMAEREGFEPPVRLHVLRISSAARSTTLPPLRGRANAWSDAPDTEAAREVQGVMRMAGFRAASVAAGNRESAAHLPV